MNKIYCPYVKGHKFVDLKSALDCSDCRYGCPLYENILKPVLLDVKGILVAMDGVSE